LNTYPTIKSETRFARSKDSSTPPQGDVLHKSTTCLVQCKWRHFHPTIGWMDRWMYCQCDLDSALGKGRKKERGGGLCYNIIAHSVN